MRWLLNVLRSFREHHEKPNVEIASVWMDIDTVDFTREPYDCAILPIHTLAISTLGFS